MHDTDLFPVIDYNNVKLKDISRRFIIKWIQSRHSKPYWFEHRMTGWKSIENVAYDFYGSCDYIWAIMVANNIVHPIHDWLKKEEEVIELAKKKYGAEFLNSPHHYEYRDMKYTTRMKTLVDARKTKSKYGYAIPQDVYDQVLEQHVNSVNEIYVGDIKVITNIQHEMEQNERKRFIKVIYPSLISSIESEMENIF